MPRYLVERVFPSGLVLTADARGAQAALAVIKRNMADGVTWIHSYVTTHRNKSFCIYDAPEPDAIRRAAANSRLPVDHIVEVRLFDPNLCL